MVHNQPYDESLDVSDGEEIASAAATPREMDRGECPMHQVERTAKT